MEYHITGKQHNSKNCFVCGLKNTFGIRASFYITHTNELVSVFTPGELHQSYPGRLHGGVATAILDETIGRAINIGKEEFVWGVTVELKTRFKKPLPLNTELKVIGRITKEYGRFFEGTGEIITPDGEVAVLAEGKYLKVPINEIGDFDDEENEWRIVKNDLDPVKINIPFK